MNQPIQLILALGLVAGCEDAAARPQEGPKRESASATAVPADNTKKNERDRSDATLTPGDQGENEADRKSRRRSDRAS